MFCGDLQEYLQDLQEDLQEWKNSRSTELRKFCKSIDDANPALQERSSYSIKNRPCKLDIVLQHRQNWSKYDFFKLHLTYSDHLF